MISPQLWTAAWVCMLMTHYSINKSPILLMLTYFSQIYIGILLSGKRLLRPRYRLGDTSIEWTKYLRAIIQSDLKFIHQENESIANLYKVIDSFEIIQHRPIRFISRLKGRASVTDASSELNWKHYSKGKESHVISPFYEYSARWGKHSILAQAYEEISDDWKNMAITTRYATRVSLPLCKQHHKLTSVVFCQGPNKTHQWN